MKHFKLCGNKVAFLAILFNSLNTSIMYVKENITKTLLRNQIKLIFLEKRYCSKRKKIKIENAIENAVEMFELVKKCKWDKTLLNKFTNVRSIKSIYFAHMFFHHCDLNVGIEI